MNSYLRLDECCQIELSSIDKKNKPNEKSVKLCNFTDVYYNWNIYSSMIDEFMEATASDKNISTFLLKKGDVVVTKDSETRDDIGMAALIYEDLPNTVLGYHCALIRPKKNIDGAYLNAYLNSYLGRKHFKNQASGSGQRYTLTKESLGSIKIPVIPMTEQKKIGAFFSDIDKKIQNNIQTITNLESLAKTIYDYWFLQFEFPNEDGKPYKSSGGKMVWNEELKQEIPEGWKIKKIREIENKIVTGKTPATTNESNYGKDIPFVTIGDIRGNMFVTNTEQCLSVEGAESQNNKYLPKDSLCVSCIASPGLIAFTSAETSQTNQQINSIVVKHEYNKLFLYFALADYFKFSSGIKTGNTFKNMNKNDFESIKVIYPDTKVLISFMKKTESSRQNILRLAKESQELVSLRDFLLPMLMNGQVTFKEDE